MQTNLRPGRYHVFYRSTDGRWGRQRSKCAARLNNYPDLPIDQSEWDLKRIYGIDDQAVHIELFRINGGRSGWYIADLVDREYHYCGEGFEEMQQKMRALTAAKTQS